MEKMTRSDILMAVSRLDQMTSEEKDKLILRLRQKIENVYTIFGAMNKRKGWEELADILRDALES